KIVINEAIELTKIFGTSSSYKFINGVLDKIINKVNIKK
ncbi:MAG: N utilization substance protein B, partial [Candidatus Lightella neohaematopini]|nr:N utilization substance protein B [Candidatus Lightella neohaematopini]